MDRLETKVITVDICCLVHSLINLIWLYARKSENAAPVFWQTGNNNDNKKKKDVVKITGLDL